MSECILNNRPPSIRDVLRKTMTRLACAILRRAARRSRADVALAVRTGQHAGGGAAAAGAEAQHPLHHGRRHRHLCSRASTIAA